MVRRRAGFFAARADIPALKADIRQMAAAGAGGLVFGFLRGPARSPRLDIAALTALVHEAGRCAGRFGKKELVFHMAFDEILESEQYAAIDTLSKLGFTRILTKGGRTGKAEDHIDRLKVLADYARGKMTILCGGGVTDDNYQKIAAAGLTEFHGRRLGFKK
jgi:copper homeostasis protein